MKRIVTLRRGLLAGVSSLALSVTAPAPAATDRSAPAPAVPGAANCPMFPANNVWNTPITKLPVPKQSAAWLVSMDAATTFLHPDFGPSGNPALPYGIPFTVVRHPRLVRVHFLYADESDKGPYPFGPRTPIEGGADATGDRHALIVDATTCTLYELYDAHYRPGGRSSAGSGAIWNLRSNRLRPATWTSADAAGLPILPGLLTYAEVRSGRVDHAIRMTAELTDTRYLWPARHEAGASDDPSHPPMGARFRLKANFNLRPYSPQARVVIRAMQRYGLILADNGSNWYFGGAAERWPLSLVNELKSIPARDFQAVDESSLMISPNSGAARQP